MKDFGKIMLIIGTVIGSGFASGKEVAVFFSRFGYFSYFFIPLVFFLFFGVFYWILKNGKYGIQRLSSSKFFLILYVIVSLVFTSSMFAGTTATMCLNIPVIDLILILALLFVCVIVSQKGVGFLAKLNSYLIPFAIVVLVCCLMKNLGCQSFFLNGSIPSGMLFTVLYVVMNVSTSCLVIGQIGQTVTKRQAVKISFFSSLILCILLLFINMVLLGNEGSISLPMPLLDISNGAVKVMMQIVIFLGCLTTLLSLIFTTSQVLRKMNICGIFNIFIAVILPFFTSFVGFGNIVSILYPITSVIGIFMLTPFLVNKKEKKP